MEVKTVDVMPNLKITDYGDRCEAHIKSSYELQCLHKWAVDNGKVAYRAITEKGNYFAYVDGKAISLPADGWCELRPASVVEESAELDASTKAEENTDEIKAVDTEQPDEVVEEPALVDDVTDNSEAVSEPVEEPIDYKAKYEEQLVENDRLRAENDRLSADYSGLLDLLGNLKKDFELVGSLVSK